VLLHHYSHDFFRVVNKIPKLHTIDLFGWTSLPSKIALVLTSMLKSYFDGAKQLFGANVVILGTL